MIYFQQPGSAPTMIPGLERQKKTWLGITWAEHVLCSLNMISTKFDPLPMKPLHLPRITCTLQRDLTGFGGMAPTRILGRTITLTGVFGHYWNLCTHLWGNLCQILSIFQLSSQNLLNRMCCPKEFPRRLLMEPMMGKSGTLLLIMGIRIWKPSKVWL